VKTRIAKMSLTDAEIIDRIAEVDGKVMALDVKMTGLDGKVDVLGTKIDSILEGRRRCDDYGCRIGAIEQYVAADRRVRGFVYAALTIGIPTITALVVMLID
jgi:hypothetical protein